jgi:hypothetical protein
VSPFRRRESAQSCSPIMADGGDAWAGTREEGSLVAGADEVGTYVVEKEGSSSSGAPASFPNRWASRESGEGNGGGGVQLGAARRKENGRERVGPGRGTTARTVGSGWLRAVRSEAAAHAHGGGGLANRGGWQGAADRWGRAATRPGVSDGVREGEG